MSRPAAAGGFTLLEMLAVVLLTSLVLGAALGHYVSLSRVTERASGHTRDVRRAAAILDRVARDLEGAFIVQTEPEEDPLENGYFFRGESRRSELGADELKFVTRGHDSRRSGGHESDVEAVGYALREGERGLELLRWSSPRAPEGYDPRVPRNESEGAHVLASGLAAFGVRFIDEEGAVAARWDSSQLERAGELPLAADIEVALADPKAPPGAAPRRYRRRVLLPVRPLDLVELLDPASLASGGRGTADEQEEAEEEGEAEGETPDVLARCQASPCANTMACDVINCSGNMGRFSASIDTIFRYELENPRTFCAWMGSHGLKKSLLQRIVPNPACR